MKMLKKIVVVLLVIVMMGGLLVSCGTRSLGKVMSVDSISYSGAYDAAEEVSYAMAPTADRSVNTADTASLELPENRKWVITMRLSAETDDLDEALAAINGQIAAAEGYIESQSIYNNSSYRRNRSAELTVRIPANRIDSFVGEVSSITNVTSSTRNVHDITLSYTDTEGRLTALKTEEQRLLELMEKAENMGDLLEIESRLTEVRYRLESYASQLRLYDNQVDYATVSLSVSQVQQYTPVEEPTFWQRIKTGLADSIVNLGEAITDTIAWIIIDLPYLIIWALILWGAAAVFKRMHKKRQSKKAKKDSAE